MNIPDKFTFQYMGGGTVYTATKVPLHRDWIVSWTGRNRGSFRYEGVTVEDRIKDGTWTNVTPTITPITNVDLHQAGVGTVIGFHQADGIGEGANGIYKTKKYANGMWRTVRQHQLFPSTIEDGCGTPSEVLREIIGRGSWIVDYVDAPSEADKVSAFNTQQVRGTYQSIRDLAIGLGLSISINPKGEVWMSNGPMTYIIDADQDLEKGLAKAEKLFADFK